MLQHQSISNASPSLRDLTNYSKSGEFQLTEALAGLSKLNIQHIFINTKTSSWSWSSWSNIWFPVKFDISFKWLAITFSHAYCTFGFAYVKGVQVIFDIHCTTAVWFLVRGYSHPTHHTGKCGSFWQNPTHASKLWSHVHECSHCCNIPLCMPTSYTGIYIPPTVTPLGDNDHNHALARLPSLHEFAFQYKNLTYAAAILSSRIARLAFFEVVWNSESTCGRWFKVGIILAFFWP